VKNDAAFTMKEKAAVERKKEKGVQRIKRIIEKDSFESVYIYIYILKGKQTEGEQF